MAIQTSQSNNIGLDKAGSYDRTKPANKLWGLDEKGKPVYKHKELWGLDENGQPIYKDVTSTNSSDKSAAQKEQRFFSFGIKDCFKALYEDTVKTFWKVLAGANLVSIVREILKNKNFSLEKVVGDIFKTDFMSKVPADLIGAGSVRAFSGKTKIFGIKLPKLPAYVAAQVSNLYVKAWRIMSRSKNLNTQTAQENSNNQTQEIANNLKNLWWMKWLNKAQVVYEEKIEPPLNKALSLMFGIHDKGKDENGKSLDPRINWKHLAGFTAASGLGTLMLPKDTQNFGLESLGESKGFKESMWNAMNTLVWTNMGRLDSYFFNKAITLHPDGYGFDACFQSAVREKMFAPIVQNFADVISTILSKHIPFVNGAFLSSIVRLPAEIVAAFLSAEVAGIAQDTRVPKIWSYLTHKVWMPFARTAEKIVSPLYKYTFGIFYKKVLGLFPDNLSHLYQPLRRSEINPKIEAEFGHRSLGEVFKEAFGGLWGQLKMLWKDSSNMLRKSVEKQSEADVISINKHKEDKVAEVNQRLAKAA